MFVLSAFADEIRPVPREQVAVLKSCGVRHIEFRSIHKTNVLALSDEQIREFKKLLDGEGFELPAIGSPVGEVAIDSPFEPQLDKFKRAVELAHAARDSTETSWCQEEVAPLGEPLVVWTETRRTLI